MKKSILTSIALLTGLLLPNYFTNACSYTMYQFGEDYRAAFLNPYILGDGYSAFFYSSEYLNHYQNDHDGNDRDRNCGEWAARLGGDISESDVREFLYRTSLDGVLNAISDGADSKRFAANPFFKALLKKENKPILDYLVFAKRYEHYSSEQVADPWADNRWETEEADKSELEALKKEAEAALQTQTNDPWLRQRYAYQLLLIRRYAGDGAGFNELYGQFFGRENCPSVLCDWAMHHKAAVVEDPAERAYLYGMSFNRCPEKNVASYQNFNKDQLEAAMSFTKNDAERAALLALFAIKNPGPVLGTIKNVVALDPTNRHLPLLLVREVNKLEDWLFTHPLTDGGPTVYVNSDTETDWGWSSQQWDEYRRINREKDLRYLAEYRQFLQKQIGGKGMDNDLLNLLAAHLLSMEQNPEAGRYLEAISDKCSPSMQTQKTAEQLLWLLNREDILKPATQDKIASLLTSLRAVYRRRENGNRDFEMLHLLLKEAYLKKGQLLYAYCFHNHALHLPSKDNTFSSEYYALMSFLDWKATEKDIDDVMALLEKPNKTAFEKYLTDTHFPSRNALLDLRGTISFRKNDLPEALAAFSKVDEDFWQTKYEFSTNLVSDPFAVLQKKEARGAFPSTKAAFVKRLLDLETAAKSDPSKAAENNLLLGHAWLQCSRLGYSWMMFCYGWSANDDPQWVDHYSYLPQTKDLQEVYFDGKRALEYFQKAKASGNEEVAAKAEFYMARIRSLTFKFSLAEQALLDSLPWNEQRAMEEGLTPAFFKEWAEAHKGTEVWDEVTGVCPGIAVYYGE